MKKILKYIFFSMLIMPILVACDDKHEDIPPTGAPDNAEKLIAGTYAGEWTRKNLSTDAVQSGVGTITFSLTEEGDNNVSVISVESAELDLGVKAPSSACNVTRLNSGELVYWNVVKNNPFGMTFNGRISPEGVATMDYNQIVRSGRKEVEFKYSFKGVKQ